jgi:hypothetical protein
MRPLRVVYLCLAGIVATLLLWEAWGSVPCVEAPPLARAGIQT